MLDRPSSDSSPHKASRLEQGIPDKAALLRFLVYRQFVYLAEEEEEEEEEAENYIASDLPGLSVGEGCRHVGYNGRWNKKADTCYCWWACASLDVSFSFI